MNAPTIADLAAKPRYVVSRGRPRSFGRKGINYSSVRHFPSAQAFAKALHADGWDVTVERRRDITSGVKSGRIYLKSPEDFCWTYFRAEKNGHVFARDTSGYRLGWVFDRILRHYGYCINHETGCYELQPEEVA